MKIYNCETCNKNYKTQGGLWKHNNNHHNINNVDIVDIVDICNICNKKFNSRQSKWYHQKKCNQNELSIIKNEYKQLKDKIIQLENNNNSTNIINNNNSNNTITDNSKQIIINYSPGTEPISHLSIDQQKEVMDKGLNSLLHLIKLNNFDKEKPEYHSYCVTALNDKHASMINTNTQTVVKTDKVELFDTILYNNINKLEIMSNNKIFNKVDREEYKDKLDRLKKILYEKKRGMKKYYSEINLLSFNNKEQIIETWNNVKKTLDNIINDENLSKSEDQEDNIIEDEPCEIKCKGITYIIEGIKVYNIKDGIKGDLYGEFNNGKIIKL
jgi:hypothetical protein